MTTTPPLISVCMPTYVTTDHAALYLEQAVHSVLQQRVQPIELLVVDDGPRGPVEKVLEKAAAPAGVRIEYRHNDTNVGTASTRNRAATEASAEYLAFLDADDRWLPEHLTSLLATIRRDQAELAFCPIAEFSDEPGFRPHYQSPGPLELRDLPNALFNRCFVLPSATLLRRDAFEAHGGFRDGQRHCEDLDLWLRFACAGSRFAFTSKATCEYRRHRLAKTTLSVNMRMHRALVYNRFHAAASISRWHRRARRSKAWWQTARAASGALAFKAAAESAKAALGFPPSAESGFLRYISAYEPAMKAASRAA